jgi:hypothetical protein
VQQVQQGKPYKSPLLTTAAFLCYPVPSCQDGEFTIEFAQLADWIADVKSAFNDELKEGGKAKYRCLGLGYMW